MIQIKRLQVEERRELFALIICLTVLRCQPSSGEPVFLGRQCTIGGHISLSGECKLLPDCPCALSNLRAGVSPPLCYQENDVPLICCPTQERISARKCKEHSKLSMDLHAKGSLSEFVPLYTSGHRDVPKYGTHTPSPSVCDSSTNAFPFISGGRAADRHEMTFASAIGYEDSGKSIWTCGGTLISETYVLTAAHCLDGKASKVPTRVLLGDKHLDKLDSFSGNTRIEANIAEIFIHPEYKRPIKYNDIGLIKLATAVSFNRAIQPACLPQPNQRPEYRNDLLVAGWGLLEYFGKRGNVLQVANITRYNTRECSTDYQSKTELPEGLLKSQICAGDKGGTKDTCDGDSGGPLVAKDDLPCMQTVIGLTSFGAKLCGSGIPAVYTNVQSYLAWIESIVWELD